jgi:hypothetical protein
MPKDQITGLTMPLNPCKPLDTVWKRVQRGLSWFDSMGRLDQVNESALLRRYDNFLRAAYRRFVVDWCGLPRRKLVLLSQELPTCAVVIAQNEPIQLEPGVKTTVCILKKGELAAHEPPGDATLVQKIQQWERYVPLEVGECLRTALAGSLEDLIRFAPTLGSLSSKILRIYIDRSSLESLLRKDLEYCSHPNAVALLDDHVDRARETLSAAASVGSSFEERRPSEGVALESRTTAETDSLLSEFWYRHNRLLEYWCQVDTNTGYCRLQDDPYRAQLNAVEIHQLTDTQDRVVKRVIVPRGLVSAMRIGRQYDLLDKTSSGSYYKTCTRLLTEIIRHLSELRTSLHWNRSGRETMNHASNAETSPSETESEISKGADGMMEIKPQQKLEAVFRERNDYHEVMINGNVFALKGNEAKVTKFLHQRYNECNPVVSLAEIVTECFYETGHSRIRDCFPNSKARKAIVRMVAKGRYRLNIPDLDQI